jgi:DNA-binding MarR family transcriptional regulator
VPSSPATARVSGCTCFKLRRLTRRVTQHYDRALAPAGLRVTQFSLLSALASDSRNGIPMSELADMLDLERTTLTRNVAPLVERRWVEVVGGADARSRDVRITAPGRAAREDAIPHWRAAQEGLVQLLGKGRTALLHELLDDTLGRVRSGDLQAAPRRPA